MRIDKYLFFIRLVKSRSLAQALVEAGHIRMNGERVTKASAEVRQGAIIAFPLRGEVRVIDVLSLPHRRGPASEARSHYRELPANVSQQPPSD